MNPVLKIFILPLQSLKLSDTSLLSTLVMEVDVDKSINSKVEMRKDVLQFYRNRRKTMEERDRTVLKNLLVMVRKRSKSQPPPEEEKEKAGTKFQNSVEYSYRDNKARKK